MRHYGYQHLPPTMWGEAFAMAASVLLIACVIWLRPWLPLAAWAIGEESLVLACSSLWLIIPLDMANQAEQCSAQIGLKFGAVGLALLALITFRLTLQDFTGMQKAGGGEK